MSNALSLTATHMIKIYPSSKVYGGNEPVDSWEAKILEDKSISIDYRLTVAMNTFKTKQELLHVINANRISNKDPKLTPNSKWPCLVDMFINKLHSGDKILLVKGMWEVVYVATIDSDCYFTNEVKWSNQGYSRHIYNHRRRITNIMALPKNTIIKNGCVGSIKSRPNHGWKIET